MTRSKWLLVCVLVAGAPASASAQAVLVSDGFGRVGWDRCALGAPDGAGGTYSYLPIFPRDGTRADDPIGARIVGGALVNEGMDYGGIQLAAAPDPCGSTSRRGADFGADVTIRADLFVPAGACGQVSVAGPYFRSRAAARGDGIIGGESSGYWVQLTSTGEVRVLDLHTNTIVARSAVGGFVATAVHPIEVVARGLELRVTVDGGLRTFTQNGAVTPVVSIPPNGGVPAGTLGIAFGAPDHRGQIGGQRADNLVVIRG